MNNFRSLRDSKRIVWFGYHPPPRVAGLVSALLAVVIGLGSAAFAQEPEVIPRPTLSESSIGEWHIVQDADSHWVWEWGDDALVSDWEQASPTFDSAYVSDVTVPDNTVYAPGERFDKVWRVRNTGSLAWEPGSRLGFVSGDRMEGSEHQVTAPVASGDTADATVALVAPTEPGNYTSNWRMVDAQGQPFGQMLTVVIQVSDTVPTAGATPTLSPKQFTPQGLRWSPNCGMALVKGYIYDREGNPVNGLRVRLWTDEWEGAISLVSGVGITYGPGEWDISLLRGQTGRFYLAVWDWQTGPKSFRSVESEVIELDFNYTVENCEPGGEGHQIAEINFVRQY
jgi:hypothetical protein